MLKSYALNLDSADKQQFDMNMNQKVCPICKISKSIDEYHTYYSKERKKHRIGNYCKPCSKIEANRRAKGYYQRNKERIKKYTKEYRAKEENKEKLSAISRKFKIKYREELQDCYIRDRLNQDNKIPTSVSLAPPEIVEAKRLQIKIKRKLKSLRNG